MKCSYCIVPKVRPHVWSRPVEEILDECRRLVRHGHREIVLTGVHLGHYGLGAVHGDCPSLRGGGDVLEVVRRSASQFTTRSVVPHKDLRRRENGTVPFGRKEGADLTALVRRILALEGTFRIRLSSLEPSEVTPELVELMAAFPDRICPHLHLPLQSGSDAVLARMCRPWSAQVCSTAAVRLSRP